MYLEQLIYLAKISELGSFSKASRALFISQPALSMAMNNFEQELGYTLFRRTPQGSVLTELGQETLAHTLDILYHVEAIKHLGERGETLYGQVNIMAFPGFYNTLAGKLHLCLRRSAPGIELHVAESSPINILEDLARGKYTLGVSGTLESSLEYHEMSLKHYRLEQLTLWDDEVVVLTSREHPFSRLPKIEIADFNNETLLVFDQHLRAGTPVFFEHAEHMPQFKELVELPDGKIIQAAIAENMGIAILPWRFVSDSPYVDSGALIWRKIHGINTSFKHFLLCRNKDRLNALEKKVIDEISMLYQSPCEAEAFEPNKTA